MDGIFVAYHNTSEIFGFQYIQRSEMDRRLYGNSLTGDAAFSLLLQAYNEILAFITSFHAPEVTIRLTFSLNDRYGKTMSIFSEEIPDINLLPGSRYDGREAGQNQRHFVVSMDSLLNGVPTEHVKLTSGEDRWGVTVKIGARASVGTVEYAGARQHILEMGRPTSGGPNSFFDHATRRS